MKSIIGFIVFVLIVVVLLFSISGKKYPRIPDDASHKAITETAACMECHGQGKQYQMKPSHPPKVECFKCHKAKRVRSAK